MSKDTFIGEEYIYHRDINEVLEVDVDFLENEEIKQFESKYGILMFLTEDSKQKSHVYFSGANTNGNIYFERDLFYNGDDTPKREWLFIDFYLGEYFERDIPLNDIKSVNFFSGLSTVVAVDENDNDVIYFWGLNTQGTFSEEVINWNYITDGEEVYQINDENIRNDCGYTTSFVDVNDIEGMKFKFWIESDEVIDPLKVTVYNQDFEQIKNIEFIEQEGNRYQFEADSQERMYIEELYWSYDNGETLNLISTEEFYLNGNVLQITLYVLIGILTIIIILGILFLLYSIFVYNGEKFSVSKVDKFLRQRKQEKSKKI